MTGNIIHTHHIIHVYTYKYVHIQMDIYLNVLAFVDVSLCVRVCERESKFVGEAVVCTHVYLCIQFCV